MIFVKILDCSPVWLLAEMPLLNFWVLYINLLVQVSIQFVCKFLISQYFISVSIFLLPADIKGFLADVKPALLSALDAEYEKNPFEVIPSLGPYFIFM